MQKILSLLLGCALLAGCGQQALPSAGLAGTQAAPAVRALSDDAEAREKGPVLMVHGHNGNEHAWDYWAPVLAKEGWQPKPINLMTDDWDAEELANQVGMHVEAICRASGRQKIDVVAHSLGGLATRHYIKFLGGDKRIRRLVTLGSPHHGIGYTLPIQWITVARFLKPGSSFIDRLNNPVEAHGDVSYTSIWSTRDYTQFLPFASGRLKGGFNYRIGGTTHSGMLTDKRLLPAIREGLLRQPGTPVLPEQKLD
jgi:triacylglycerol lipase